MQQQVFNHTICVYDFDDYAQLETKVAMDNILDELFALPEVINKENVDDAQGGRAFSTVHLSQSLVIPEILNFKQTRLGVWILRNLYQSAQALGLDKTRNIKKMKYHRTWVNRMTKGCDAVAHRHAGEDWSIPHLVAIFYTQVPDDSADLIFIDDDNFELMRGSSAKQYPLEKQYKIESKAGRLVCHDAKAFHATSVHNSDLPRSCIIIEVGFPPLEPT